jgi:hypothetical protein
MTLPARPCSEHNGLTHRSSLRLVLKSVDRFDGRMTIAISLGEPGSAEQER